MKHKYFLGFFMKRIRYGTLAARQLPPTEKSLFSLTQFDHPCVCVCLCPMCLSVFVCVSCLGCVCKICTCETIATPQKQCTCMSSWIRLKWTVPMASFQIPAPKTPAPQRRRNKAQMRTEAKTQTEISSQWSLQR